MKKIFTVVSALLIAVALFAQAPASFKYQAVLRDARGNIKPNTSAKINIDILKGSAAGTAVYSETHNATTDIYGLINLEIGNGTATKGNISSIDWGSGAYFVKVIVDDVEMGTGQLLSVPYALYSSKASNGFSGNYIDLTNKPALFDGTWSSLTGKPAFAPIALSGNFTDLAGKPTTLAGYGITNAMTTSLPANSISSTNITNWKTAYSWGNHAGLYRPVAWVPDWTDVTGKPIFAPVAISGSYDDVINKPSLAQVASTGSYTDLINLPSLATVANSGSYNDLINVPTLATVAISGDYVDLVNTPSLSPVAISGSYSDLINKPTGASVGDMQYWNGTDWVLVPSGLPGQFLQMAASNTPSWTGSAFPILSSAAASAITKTTATSGGNVTSDGGAAVTARGVCWSTSPNPTIANSKTTDAGTIGVFLSSITGLTHSTTYYLRAYATNSVGTGYGNEISFTTNKLPALTTTAVSLITSNSALAGGDITNDGGAAVTARGVCWSITTNPTTADNNTSDGTGSGTFASSITGLSLGVTYYVRAYATNTVGTAYGNEVSFTTTKVPGLNTPAASSITQASATCGGDVISDGGTPVTSRGVCWSISAGPTTADNKTTDGAGTGAFVSSISGLTMGTTYYVRAYAVNTDGTGYGNEISFTTLAMPVTTTNAASAITQSSSTSGGNVTGDGGAAVTSKGVCWGTSANPTTSDSFTTDGTGTGTFVSSITGLTAGTIYYVRAYATNSVGTSYGTQVSFTTLSLPVLTTTAASSITQSAATGGGDVTSDGGAAVTVRGICWSTTVNPTTTDSKTTDGAGTAVYTSAISGLTPGTLYYVRAYATNSVGTAYGSQISFTSLATFPTLAASSAASLITQITAISGGNITTDGGAAVTARGVCWNITSSPTIADSKTTDGTGTGIFTSSLTGLTPATTYAVRSYATNSIGTSYGSEISFTTNPATVAVLTSTAAYSISQTTASGGGNITSDGASAVTARGVCWSTITNPTIADSKTSDGTGQGVFTSSLSGLTLGTTYYVRAYATNSVGTAYGNEISFITTKVPAVNTTATTSVTQSAATSGGNVTSDGGLAVTERGMCWSTSSNPTIADSKTSDGTGTGVFISSITGLTLGTTYYMRAYATNSEGTGYGNEVTFTTLDFPVITTTAVSSVTQSSATSGGNITTDGGANVSSRGVCWGTSTNPVATGNHTTDATGTGIFASLITGLTQGTTYYVRAYATNSVGTSYGAEVSFTTLASPSLAATTTASLITTTTASTGGNITSDGGSPVTTSGVCWSTSSNPLASGNHSTDGTALGVFTSSITGLTQGTLYYIRSYATNSVGTSYGSEISFTTLTTPSLAATTTASAITNTAATSGGNITSDGGPAVTASGVCWGTSSNPVASGSHTTDGTALGIYTSSITGLSANTTYYVRAYATNSVGTSYGAEISFVTTTLPTLAATTAASSITQAAATSGGNITNDGGASVTVRGVCWSTAVNPTIADSKTSDGSGTGVFSSSITGLTQGTTYYVRAYATNSVGTSYGAQTNFTTTTAPTLAVTTAVTAITQATATSGGNITNDGGSAVTASGVCWSTSSNPLASGNRSTDGTALGVFTSSITGLTSNTTYYVRAYATNSVGTSYGAEVSFTTPTIPVLAATTAASSIATTTASSGGNITSNGGSAVTVSGVCWGTSSNPVATGSHSTDGTALGVYTSSITGLLQGTTYYVRAYATNSVGTAYGSEVSFTTLTTPTLAATTIVSSITTTTATSGGNITSNGGSVVTVSGVCWGISSNPVATGSHSTDGTALGIFTSSITGLTQGTTYYVRAYATNGVGTSYGSEVSFTTLTTPTLSATTAASAITNSSATSGGDITSNGGAVVTASGICWSTSSNPVATGSHSTDGTALGVFTSSITGLLANTTYYVRAYATNSVGTSYGSEISFTTTTIPVLAATTVASAITTTTATSGGNITNDGGSAVTASGVCWSTAVNPTIGDSKSTDGTALGVFTSSISGLTQGTTYYIRAYATNSVGTAYGTQVSFTTLTIPSLAATTAASAITTTTATSGGNITSNGGAVVSASGVCWATTSNPVASGSHSTDGSAIGVFSSSITGLAQGTTYYARAYATNSVGTAYGAEVSFTTLTTPTLAATTAASSLTTTSATSGGNITNNGGTAVSVSGVCWSTIANPTTSDSKTTDGTAIGIFTSSITGLAQGTTYFVRAYATNSVGTSYGTQISFTTLTTPTLGATTAASSITTSTASSGGDITSDGGTAVTASGVCWGTSSNPVATGNHSTDGTSIGVFTSSITGLTLGTTYFVRSYATNSVGTSYGTEVSFTTITTPSLAATTVASLITSTTASSGGNITSNGGTPVTASGVCWGISSNPVATGSHTTDGTALGVFTSSITGLSQGTTYYIRAYATNSVGTAYGAEVSFTTTTTPTLAATTAASSITSTAASSGGDVTSDGGASVTARGVCWSTIANPTTTDSKTTDGAGTGVFVSSITGLTPGTTYFVRSYATNNVGTSYGVQVSFTTPTTPTLAATTAASAINLSTATSGGNITSDGGSAVTVRGVCWNTAINPTTLNSKTSDGTGAGVFASSITGLAQGTTYYVRAYATNSVGTTYGAQISFTTLALPTLTTTAESLVTQTTATSGGNVLTNGSSAVTSRGVCWSTSANPTITDSKTINGFGLGSFSSSMTGLTAGTTYNVRAYATNSAGTGYGNNISFTTQQIYGTVTDIDGITYNTVTKGSQVWMAENLKTTKYQNGDLIGTTTSDISGEGTPKYQWAYNNDEGNVATYGRLYTWDAVTDGRNVCPTGWHVPSDDEITTLTTFLGGESVAGGKLKEAGFTHWQNPNTGATNESGLTALPSGYRSSDGTFASLGNDSYWWSSLSFSGTDAWYRDINYSTNSVTRSSFIKQFGFSVRCVQD